MTSTSVVSLTQVVAERDAGRPRIRKATGTDEGAPERPAVHLRSSSGRPDPAGDSLAAALRSALRARPEMVGQARDALEKLVRDQQALQSTRDSRIMARARSQSSRFASTASRLKQIKLQLDALKTMPPSAARARQLRQLAQELKSMAGDLQDAAESGGLAPAADDGIPVDGVAAVSQAMGIGPGDATSATDVTGAAPGTQATGNPSPSDSPATAAQAGNDHAADDFVASVKDWTDGNDRSAERFSQAQEWLTKAGRDGDREILDVIQGMQQTVDEALKRERDLPDTHQEIRRVDRRA